MIQDGTFRVGKEINVCMAQTHMKTFMPKQYTLCIREKLYLMAV